MRGSQLLYCVFAFFAIGVTTLKAQSGIYESYAIINTGSGNTYFDLQANTGNTDFEGANLGNYNCDGSLILNGAQNKIFKCNTDNITDGFLNYRIYLTTDTPPAFSGSVALPFLSDDGATAICNPSTGINQTWEEAAANINLISGLALGSYYLEVYTTADYTFTIGAGGSGTHFANNDPDGGGPIPPNNYKAIFTVIDATAPIADAASLSDITAECEVTSFTAPTATDNCGGFVTVTNDATVPISGEGTTTVVTWTYDDGNGNTSTQTQNVIIDDVSAPTPDAASLSDITAECEVTSLTAPTATDNCGGIVTVTNNVTFPISGEGTTTVVTWTYDDGNGNTSTQAQNVIIDDVTAPIPDVANLLDITAECEVTSLIAPTATDNCGGIVTVTNDATLPISGEGTTTVVTWTYDDGNGNTSTQAQNVIIDDVTAPIPDVANLSDITAECEVTSLTAPTATDNCGGIVTVTNNATLPISGEGTTTVVTWTYDDGNGNTSTQTQNVITDDVSAPTPDVANLSDITAECEVTSLTAPTAADNCGGTVTVTNNATLPISGEGTTTVVTWTYDDGNGNTSTQTQDVIIDDVSAPIADAASLSDITAECEVTSLTAPIATDNCGGTVTVTNDATLPISGEGTTTVVTWTYNDGNGNTSTQTQNVIIDDVSAPIADAVSLSDITAECEVTSLTAPTATDNCGGTLTVTNNVTFPISGEGTTTVVTWTYDDGNGNTSTQTQVVIIDDVSAPIADAVSLSDITAECEVTSLTAPTAADNCGGTVTVTNNATLPISGEGTTTVVTWTYDDGNGNTSIQTQNVIIDDVSAPIADAVSLSDITAECEVTSLTAPTATDNCGGTVTVTNNVTFPISGEGTTTVVTWTYDDGNGNTSTQTQNVVIDDVLAPIADVANLSDITAECEVTSLTAPTATDNCGGTVTVTNDATLPISGEGTTTVVTWTYDDGNGNTSIQTQNVIIDDVSAPIADAVSLSDITAECEVTSLTAPTATDNCGGIVTVTNNVTFPISGEGTTTVVTWTYDDGNGNTSTQTQVVIIDDVSAPIADAASLSDITAECEVTSLTAPTATDNCGGIVTVTNDATLPISGEGTTTVVTWTYDDGNGNTSTQTQDVIIDDVSPPIPDVASLSDITAECEVTSLTAPTATDNCGGTVTVTNNATLPISGEGTTTVVTWTYDDGNGNTSTQTQNVIIDDVSAPTPDVANLSDITAECEVTSLTAPTATDNCGGTVTVTNNATLPISGEGTTTVVTWTYDDGNGNIFTQAQNVIIDDVSAPIADAVSLSDITAECEVTSLTSPTATDNCGGIVTVTNDATLPISGEGTTTVVTWTYDDGNGNTSTQIQNVIIDDVTAPTPDTVSLSDITAECEVTSLIAPTSTDNCGGTVTVTNNVTLPISGEGTTTVVTWTYDDGNGNSSTQTQNVIIDDVSGPIVPNLPLITGQCSATVSVPTTTDGCSGTITGTTLSPLSYNSQGSFAITWNFDDGNGNAVNVVQNVIIDDTIDPVAVCQNLTIQLDDTTGNASITSAQIDNGSTDNCGVVNFSLSQSVFDCTNIGSNVVVLTVDDGNGNSDTCTAIVTVTSPNISGGTILGYLSNSVTSDPSTEDDLVEVTACPDEPQNVIFNLTGQTGNVAYWQSSIDGGVNWIDIANTTTTYFFANVLETTLIRAVIQIGSCRANSTIVVVAVIPPDVPPTIVGPTEFNICLGADITVVAESSFGINPQLNDSGEFNQGNLPGWLVDGNNGINNWSASGSNSSPTPWRGISNGNGNNGSNITAGVRYKNQGGNKFAISYGDFGAPSITTLETPVFSTLALSTASLDFQSAYYLQTGAVGMVELSVDGGATYPISLMSFSGPGDSGGFALEGNGGNSVPTIQLQDPGNAISLDLSDYIGLTNLRIRFKFNSTAGSSWAIDGITIPQAPVDEVIEWTDGNGTVVTTGSTTTITPVTPGIQTFGVTSLINGCRADGNEGTEFIDVDASLAYAGENIIQVIGECGEDITLNAYDNSLSAADNITNGVSNGAVFATGTYPGTGAAGVWSATAISGCGSSYEFSDLSSPRSRFSAEPGTYQLTWTVAISAAENCSNSIQVVIESCPSIDFDGLNDYVTFDDNYDLSNQFSIEAWVKPESVVGTQSIFTKRDANNLSTGYDLRLVGTIVEFNWNSTGTIQSSYPISVNRWYHLAVTNSNGNYRLYIDGIAVSSPVAGSAPTPNAMTSIIGAMDQANSSPNRPVDYFNGWIDELRIWNTALTPAQIRFMMNQEIENNTAVRGAIVPLDIPGLPWSALDGYYRMDVNCGQLTAYKGIRGKLRNITSSQQDSAPLPYTSRVDGQDWTADNTWTNFNVWDTPNSVGVDGSTPIDWNIVQTSHNINSGNKDITVLGLISDTANKVLDLKDPLTTQDETNNGQFLRVSHYLKLDGDIDLFGESQLLQDEGSILDVTSTGSLERDQQGTTNLYNYNYWSSPVSALSTTSNNNPYGINDILRDGTTSSTPLNLQWTTAQDAIGSTSPITQSSRWLYAYENYPVGITPEDGYAQWRDLSEFDILDTGLGFTMKGSGSGDPISDVQNYVFVGKPNNATITTPITIGNQALVGNPYPSAINADQFIRDNLPGASGNSGSTQSIDGTLYFWEHYISNFTHILEDYEGGYATYNLSGGNPAVSPPLISGNGTSTKLPGQYIPVSQGFFVTASPLGGQIQFKNSQRVFARETGANSEFIRSNNPNMYTSQQDPNPEIQRVRLEFNTEDGAIRPLLLAFVPNNQATDGFDFGYDAENSDGEFPNDMFWRIEDGNYTTQGVGEFDFNKQYPLAIFLNTTGSFEISLKQLENFDTSIKVYIHDVLLSTYFEINSEAYETILDADSYIDRFYVTFSSEDTLSTISDELSQMTVNYLTSTHEIFIKTSTLSEIKSVSLINLLGQEVMHWNNVSEYQLNDTIRIPAGYLSEGAYIIKVNTIRNVHSSKVIVKE